jgi:hypothetical protein
MNFLKGFLGQIISLIGGGAGGALQLVTNLLASGMKMVLDYQNTAFAFSRQIGASSQQAASYTKVLTERAKDLGIKYGIAADAVMKLEQNLARATGRALIMTKTEADVGVALSKLVGEQTYVNIQEQINGMGGQISTMNGAVAKAYATAVKSGLDAVKYSDKFAKNLSMMNRFNLRNGVDDIAKMTALSEKLSINLASIEPGLNKFFNIGDAIENAAKLTMLGGPFGAFGGNPLDMAYEANYDQAAFMDRTTKMLKGLAVFDEVKGMSNLIGGAMDYIQQFSQIMGMSVEETTKMTKKLAETGYKEEKLSPWINNSQYDSIRDLIINRSQVRNGQVFYTGSNGKSTNITEGIEGIPKEERDMLERLANGADENIVRQEAQVNSLIDTINGAVTTVTAQIAEVLAEPMEKFHEWIREHIPTITEKIGDMVNTAKNFIAKFSKDYSILKTAIIGYIGFMLAKSLFRGILSPGGSAAMGTAARGVSAAGSAIKGGWSNMKSFFKYVAEGFKTARASGDGFFKSILMGFKKPIKYSGEWWRPNSVGGYTRVGNQDAASGAMRFGRGIESPFRAIRRGASAIKNGWKSMGMLNKIGMGVGVAASAIEGIAAYSNYKNKVNEINNSDMSDTEKARALDEARVGRNSEIGGAVGTAVGSVVGAFFGPIGMFIGPVVGKFIGSFIGKYWDPFVNGIKSVFSAIGDGFSSVWKFIKKCLQYLIDYNPLGLLVKGIGKLFGKDWSITGAFSGMFGGSKGAETHHRGGGIGGDETLSPAGQFIARVMNDDSNNVGFSDFVARPMANNEVPVIGQVGELTVNEKQQDKLASSIVSKPVGGRTYIYTPQNVNGMNAREVRFSDINLNVNGTFKLELNGSTQNVDVRDILSKLADDPIVKARIADIAREVFQSDNLQGRVMYDTSYLGGLPSAASTLGRMDIS